MRELPRIGAPRDSVAERFSPPTFDQYLCWSAQSQASTLLLTIDIRARCGYRVLLPSRRNAPGGKPVQLENHSFHGLGSLRSSKFICRAEKSRHFRPSMVIKHRPQRGADCIRNDVGQTRVSRGKKALRGFDR
jgi:hypothetical protein